MLVSLSTAERTGGESTYRVLLVDDDAHILTTNEKFLRQKGYEVFCAGTAQDALRVATTATLNAIILDVDLPGLDGLSVCRRSREVSRVPVIFLSAYARTDDRIQGLPGRGEDRAYRPVRQLLPLLYRTLLPTRRGAPGAVSRLLVARTVVYGFLCFVPSAPPS